MTNNIAKIMLLIALASGSSFMYFFSTKSNDNQEKLNPTRVEYMSRMQKYMVQILKVNFYTKLLRKKLKLVIPIGKFI